MLSKGWYKCKKIKPYGIHYVLQLKNLSVYERDYPSDIVIMETLSAVSFQIIL